MCGVMTSLHLQQVLTPPLVQDNGSHDVLPRVIKENIVPLFRIERTFSKASTIREEAYQGIKLSSATTTSYRLEHPLLHSQDPQSQRRTGWSFHFLEPQGSPSGSHGPGEVGPVFISSSLIRDRGRGGRRK